MSRTEELKQMAANERLPQSERDAARAALAQLEPISDEPQIEDAAAERTERWLATIPLDTVARRCLTFAGQRTMYGVTDAALTSFLASEEEQGHSKQTVDRLWELRNAACDVHAYEVDPEEQPDVYRLFILLEMIEPGEDRKQELARAKTKYRQVASERE